MNVGLKRPPIAARATRSLAVAGLGFALAVPAAAQGMDPWSKDRQWIAARVGYAKSVVEGAADGSFGGGLGYTRFLSSKWAIGAIAELNLLGKFGGAAEIEAPWTIELSRHYRWPTIIRPFLGVGAGFYYHKFYRTGADAATIQPGFHLAAGTNASISEHGLLGFDVRMNVVSLDDQDNPAFGAQTDEEKSNRAVHWSAKVNLGWAF